jgi:cytochrome oxidase Cu insertion factor (SCO1/SenC/PrrC family)
MPMTTSARLPRESPLRGREREQVPRHSAAVTSFSTEHRLDTIPSWHFFTGSPAALETVWRAYGIEVEAPNPNADIIHTSAVYFIDPSGREPYVATPMADHIALVARSLAR